MTSFNTGVHAYDIIVMGATWLPISLPVSFRLRSVVNATVVTEMQALRILAGVKAAHVASGGLGGCEGTVALVVEGTDEAMRRAFEVVVRSQRREANTGGEAMKLGPTSLSKPETGPSSKMALCVFSIPH